jgi:hypothetical protein
MRLYLVAALGLALALGGCVTTSMQGYADKDLPSQPIAHVAALVTAPLPLAQSMQASLTDEGAKLHVTVDDALTIFPPTRQYTDAEVKRELKERGIDGVLVVNVGDSGVMQQYLGTLLSGSYSGSTTGMATVNAYGGMSTASYQGMSTGNFSATATPIYRSSRQTTFSAKLLDALTGRILWVGNGQIDASGKLFVGVDTSASKAVGAILTDWQSKGIVVPPT